MAKHLVVSVLLAVAGCLAVPKSSLADLIYESATLGVTGGTNGATLSSQYVGSRFTLSQLTEITHIGGHIHGIPVIGFEPKQVGSNWGAIIALDPGPTALPGLALI